MKHVLTATIIAIGAFVPLAIVGHSSAGAALRTGVDHAPSRTAKTMFISNITFRAAENGTRPIVCFDSILVEEGQLPIVRDNCQDPAPVDLLVGDSNADVHQRIIDKAGLFFDLPKKEVVILP